MDAAPATATAVGPAPTGSKGFGISDEAAARLQKMLMERQTPDAGLRVAVKGGGCSGLTYSMEWSEKARERDKIFEKDGVHVFVDPKSYLYLMGSELHYEETLMTSGFKLRNPNMKSACGCGDSFTI